MEYGAIDLHLRRSQIRIIDAEEHVVLDRRIETTREALTQVFGGRRLRILLESGTESEWVAQHLEGLGHEVVVADPNYAPMYGSRSRKVKTDRRDVAALAVANRRGLYRAAHRATAAARAQRQTLRIRRQLVRMRSGVISLLRAVLRQEGFRLGAGTAETVIARLDAVGMPSTVATIVAPLRATLEQLTGQLIAVSAAIEAAADATPVTRRLMTAPGVGPIVAATFVATLDDVGRFGGDAARVSAYLGLVPTEFSSAERQRKGHITKTGPGDLRALLVQASWTIWRSTRPEAAALRTWAQVLAARRGRRIAIVAVARRLSRILYAMWRDGQDFHAPRSVSEAAA
ncbi:MAG TPA: IS110 family transposase [Vicinamibacterales bacterium]|jgi:transposase|nr:IS110 family transposase [Vicinamibacterales bacterium]